MRYGSFAEWMYVSGRATTITWNCVKYTGSARMSGTAFSWYLQQERHKECLRNNK